VNQYWIELRVRRRRALRRQNKTLPETGRLGLFGFQALTFVAVLFSDVLFRARTVHDAVTVWAGMLGLGGTLAGDAGRSILDPALATLLAASAAIVFLAPNTQQIMSRFDPAFNWRDWKHTAPSLLAWTWKPNAAGIAFAGFVFFMGVMFIQRGQAIFLYFNF
jgi:hypothetical protein